MHKRVHAIVDATSRALERERDGGHAERHQHQKAEHDEGDLQKRWSVVSVERRRVQSLISGFKIDMCRRRVQLDLREFTAVFDERRLVRLTHDAADVRNPCPAQSCTR